MRIFLNHLQRYWESAVRCCISLHLIERTEAALTRCFPLKMLPIKVPQRLSSLLKYERTCYVIIWDYENDTNESEK